MAERIVEIHTTVQRRSGLDLDVDDYMPEDGFFPRDG